MIKLVIIFTLLLAGCTLTPKKNVQMAIYDFGLQSSAAHNRSNLLPGKILVADITAPVWLDNQSIQYRLVYHDPARIYTYANSRWAASPARLLTRRIKDSLLTRTQKGIVSSQNALKADHALLIELEEFIQVFEQPDKSRAIIRLRASLIERNARQLLTQRKFSIEQDTSTADAAGAVSAMILASDTLANELIAWLIDNLAEINSANK